MAGPESTEPRGLRGGLRRLPRTALARTALLVVLLVAGGVVALLVDVPGVVTLRSWLDQLGTVGWVALVLGLALATLAPIPRTALSVLCGVLAGFWGGLALALASGVLGALVGFALARSLGRETVTQLAGPRLARADELLASRGAVAVLMGRLIPITPFTLVSYAGGLSGIPLRSYLLGSAVGLVPGTVLHVTIGATVGAAGDGPVLLLSLVPLALALLALVLVHRWHVRRRPALLPQGAEIEHVFEDSASLVDDDRTRSDGV